MKFDFKKLLLFILVPLSLGALVGLLTSSNSNVNSIIPPWIFPIVWTILYILIAISIYLIYKDNSYKNTPEYNKTLLINYFSNQVFSFLFFTLKSPFLALIDTVIVLISSLFLYYESKELNKISAKLLIPYIIWNIFAAILIISIFFMNL